MRHRIHDVIGYDAECQAGELFIIFWPVRILPRISEIHVVADRYNQAAFVVVDAAPARSDPILFVGAAATQVLCSRDLIAAIQVVNRMENWVFVWNVDDLPIRENSLHALDEYRPFPRALKIFDHQTSTAIQDIAHLSN